MREMKLWINLALSRYPRIKWVCIGYYCILWIHFDYGFS